MTPNDHQQAQRKDIQDLVVKLKVTQAATTTNGKEKKMLTLMRMTFLETYQMPTTDDYCRCLDMNSEAAGPLAVPGVRGSSNDWARPYRPHFFLLWKNLRNYKLSSSFIHNNESLFCSSL